MAEELMPLPGWPDETLLVEPMPGTGAAEGAEEKVSCSGRFIAVDGNKWYLRWHGSTLGCAETQEAWQWHGLRPSETTGTACTGPASPECKHAPHGIPGPAAVPACMVRDSEFFTASLAVPLPARRVLHTSHPKDANRLGPDFSKSKTFCNFVLSYTTSGNLWEAWPHERPS